MGSYSGWWSHFPSGNSGLRTDAAPSCSTARRASVSISSTSPAGRTAVNFIRLGSTLQYSWHQLWYARDMAAPSLGSTSETSAAKLPLLPVGRIT